MGREKDRRKASSEEGEVPPHTFAPDPEDAVCPAAVAVLLHYTPRTRATGPQPSTAPGVPAPMSDDLDDVDAPPPTPEPPPEPAPRAAAGRKLDAWIRLSALCPLAGELAHGLSQALGMSPDDVAQPARAAQGARSHGPHGAA